MVKLNNLSNYINQGKIFQKIFFYFLLKYCTLFKNIILFNAAGYKNIGDDLMAIYLKKRLEKKSSIFNIVFNNIEKVKENLKELELIPINSDYVFNFNKKNTLIICGGGTLINPLVFPNDFYLQKINYFQKKGFKTCFLGIEITGISNKNLAKKVFNNALFIGVRNQQTKDIILKIYHQKEKKPLIIITGDIIEHINFQKNKKINQKIVGICLSPKINLNEEKIKILIKKLLKKNYQIEFFSFCQHETHPPENDLILANNIKNKYFKNEKKIKIFDKVNIDETINHLDNYSIIITTRLHVTIIAHKKQIKVFNINWEEKCKNYCQNNNLFNGTIEELLKKIKEL